MSESIRQWMGDSRGHWDGDTLVVETSHFSDKTSSFNPTIQSAVGSGLSLRLVERFTRHDDHTLHYEFRIEDDTTFIGRFSGMIPMKRSDGPIFEYACHEGNYGMFNLLAGARAEERERAERAEAATGR